jgi:hypothetical protein
MYRLCLAVIGGLAMWPLTSRAVTQDNFLARTTADLVELCAAPEADPLRVAAVHFCEGYIVGVSQYSQAVSAAPGEPQLFCLPKPPPSRDDAVAMFVTWARRNANYMTERPVDTLMRFAGATWPCKR